MTHCHGYSFWDPAALQVPRQSKQLLQGNLASHHLAELSYTGKAGYEKRAHIMTQAHRSES
jgi:hypothetical protein